MENEVNDAARVAPLVVVPGDELAELVVERDTGLGVEDGRARVVEEVTRHELLISVAHDALEGTLGSLLDDLADLSVGGGVLELEGHVDDGDVGGGDTEGHASELALDSGPDLTDGGGSTSGRGDEVGSRSAALTPALLGRAVDDELSGGVRVDSGHEALLNAEGLVDDLDERSEAVGSARGVGDDGLASVLLLVDAHDEHGGRLGGSSDDNLLGTTLDVLLALGDLEEDTSRLDDDIGTNSTPRNLSGITPTKRQNQH